MSEKLKEQLSRKGEGVICPIAIFIREGKILLGLRNYTKDKWKDISVWTSPGGRSENNETIEETLRREVYEETGIKNFEILDFIGEFPGAKEGDTGLLFLCETNEDAKLMEPEKFSEWKWFSLDSFPENHINAESCRILISYFEKNFSP